MQWSSSVVWTTCTYCCIPVAIDVCTGGWDVATACTAWDVACWGVVSWAATDVGGTGVDGRGPGGTGRSWEYVWLIVGIAPSCTARDRGVCVHRTCQQQSNNPLNIPNSTLIVHYYRQSPLLSVWLLEYTEVTTLWGGGNTRGWRYWSGVGVGYQFLSSSVVLVPQLLGQGPLPQRRALKGFS